MARHTLAVPATGTGVEREFSKSRRVYQWSRSKLNASTVTDTTMLKDDFSRGAHPLVEFEGQDLMLGEELE